MGWISAVTLAGGYARMWQATNVLLRGLGAPECARVLGGTAVEVYRLPIDAA